MTYFTNYFNYSQKYNYQTSNSKDKLSLLKILNIYVQLVEYLNDKIIHFLETLCFWILDSCSTSQVI